MRKLLLGFLIAFLFASQSWAAWTFSNSTNNVQVADNTAFTLPDGDWTISVVITRTSVPSYDARVFETVGTFPLFSLYTNSASVVGFYAEDDDSTVLDIISASSTLDSSPHTLTAIRSGNRVDLYLDTTSVANVTNASFDAVNGQTLYIGNRGGGTQDRGFPGSIAELVIWHRALSTAELTALSDRSSQSCVPAPVLYVPAIRDYNELVKGASVTNTSSTVGAHPRMVYCGG